MSKLQQYLPLAVLKQLYYFIRMIFKSLVVATVLTACGIETDSVNLGQQLSEESCNSTYRLRY